MSKRGLLQPGDCAYEFDKNYGYLCGLPEKDHVPGSHAFVSQADRAEASLREALDQLFIATRLVAIRKKLLAEVRAAAPETAEPTHRHESSFDHETNQHWTTCPSCYHTRHLAGKCRGPGGCLCTIE